MDTWKLCDVHFKIPMSEYGVGSLNVSVATGVALFEVLRQKMLSAG
jgi:tRNA G18 (ribose-2'-O)-methylase SpoU